MPSVFGKLLGKGSFWAVGNSSLHGNDTLTQLEQLFQAVFTLARNLRHEGQPTHLKMWTSEIGKPDDN